MDRSRLRPGDLLFYKTTLDGPSGAFDGLEAEDFEVSFEALAAFAQGLPYHVVDGRYRPWYHVAICVEGGPSPQAVGFNASTLSNDDIGRVEQFSLGAGNADPVFLPGTPNDSAVGVEVLRLADGNGLDLDKVVAAARDQIGTVDYSVAGLIGYALATNAWMLPDCRERRRLLAQARGADLRSRQMFPEAETCTTSVAKALAAGGLQLQIGEPPVPAKRTDLDKDTDRLLRSIKATLKRFRRGQLNHNHDLDREQLDDDRVVTNGLDLCRSLGEPAGRCVGTAVQPDEAEAAGMLTAANYMMSQLEVGNVMEQDGPRELTFQLTVSKPQSGTDPVIGFELVDMNSTTTPNYDRLTKFDARAALVPGVTVGDVGNYITVMERAQSLLLGGVDPKDLEAEGRAVMDQPLTADSLLLSPAMLWEALQPHAAT